MPLGLVLMLECSIWFLLLFSSSNFLDIIFLSFVYTIIMKQKNFYLNGIYFWLKRITIILFLFI